MKETCSIAKAKNELPRLVHEAEERSPVIITRRGKPVAVIVPYEDYKRIAQKRSFASALDEFRESLDNDQTDLAEAFEGVRDSAQGREVDI